MKTVDLRIGMGVAAAAVALVASACTSTVPQPTQATTEDGFLLPPGRDADDLTTSPSPVVTVFDNRTVCDPSADDLDVLRMQALVAAYNARDTEALFPVLQSKEIYDATAIPHIGSAYSDDPMEWAQAGWDVNDQLRLVMVQPYAGAGADGRIERHNDLLEQAGIDWLSYTFKVQASGCAITWFVGYRPLADECDWYIAFSDQLSAAAVVDQGRPSKVLVPDGCEG